MKEILENFTNMVGKATGFDRTSNFLGEDALQKLFDNSYFGGEPLKNYLNYRHFDNISGNFLMTNGASGFLLEIFPLVGISDEVVKSLNMFFENELPKDGYLQFFLMASSDITGFLNFWKKGNDHQHPILQRMTQERSEYLLAQARALGKSGKKLPRTYKIYVSYSKICKNFSRDALDEVNRFKTRLMDLLSSLNLSPSACETDDLVRFCKEFFELDLTEDQNYEVTNKHDSVNNQCLQAGNYYQHRDDAFVNTNKKIAHRAYNFTQTPDVWSLAQNIQLLGNALGVPIPARFCLSIIVTNDFKTNKSLIARGQRTIDSAERPYSRHNKALQEEAIEWRDIIHSLEGKGEQALSESMCMFMSCREEYIDKAESDVKTIFSTSSWGINPLNYYHLEAMLGHMPMHGANFWYEMRRHKLVQTALSSEVVAKLPIHGEWYGVPLAGVPLIGRRGQIFNWNPYHRIMSGNYNVNVCGPTGSGKSVFLQDLARSLVAQDVKVFILEIGKSFASFGQLLGGEAIEFGDVKSYTINPFNGLRPGLNEDELNQIVVYSKELIGIMVGASGDFEMAMLESAIKEATFEYEYNLDIEKFVIFLKKSNSEILQRFGTSLFSYTSKGVYGKYFSNQKPANFDKEITVFEFEYIQNQNKLISIVLQSLLMQITAQFLVGDRSKKFTIIVDEAWRFLDHSAGFFAACARNFRRYGGSLITCTQGFKDLQGGGDTEENNNARRAIYENSAWKVVVKPESITDFLEHPEFKEKVSLIRSLSFEPGKYSEMLLSCSGTDVVGRFILDPYSLAVYSTEQRDFEYLERQEELNIPIDKAIDNLVDEKQRRKNYA